MRIVGGEWRGRAIDAPPELDGKGRHGKGRKARSAPPSSLRPTTDRARETLFNVLTHDPDVSLRDVTVLDVFAGTGALGIETLSRGAAHATFIERDASARRLINGTLRRVGGTERASVLDLDAIAPGHAPRTHDVVLLDPPYGEELGERALAALAAHGWLADGARVVVEEEAGTAIAWPSGFVYVREMRVGGSRFHLATFDPARTDADETTGTTAHVLRHSPPTP